MPARERGVGLVDRVKATERVRERERGAWVGRLACPPRGLASGGNYVN